MGKIACVAVVKNEARHIAEWIAYQFVIGFDTVVILDNLSTDATRAIALEMAARLDVRVVEAPDTSAQYQTSAYAGALRQFGAEFTWMAFFDADEFLVLDAQGANPQFSLPDLLARHETTAAIGVNWAIFGSSGHRDWPAGWSLEAYRWRSEAGFGPNLHVKSIVRPGRVLGIINVHAFDMDGPYRHLSGADILWSSPGIVAHGPDYREGKLHHYFVRSWQDWQAKMHRGYHDLTREMGEFEVYDRNEVLDESAALLIGRLKGRAQRGWLTINGVALGVNIAVRKPADQSSVSAWSLAATTDADAAGAVNGIADGRRKFHTAFEQNAWWQVDLQENVTIGAVRIYNTNDDTADRFQRFSLAISLDGQDWIEFCRKETPGTVGSITSTPFTWVGQMPVWGRFVRVTSLDEGFLHLDQVEIYSRAGRTRPIPAAALEMFAFERNPLGERGFVVGWEAALLGNRLSTFGNLFALAARTGIATAYPQMMSTSGLFDMADDPYFFISNLHDYENADIYRRFCDDVAEMFSDGFAGYMRRFSTIPLSVLPGLTSARGIIAHVSYDPQFHDLMAHEDAIKEFCRRGNCLVLAGAFWYQYLDMRRMSGAGAGLRRKLRLRHEDGAGERALAMQAGGAGVLRIGMYLRRGEDYRHWLGGAFFFDINAYVAVMRRIHASLNGAPHCFYVCSDKQVDREIFAGLPVWYEAGSQEDDFTALSKCDYVVGPASTFGTWSAFLGGAKRLILTQERLAGLDNWVRPLDDAVDILFPTGGYVPGDPAARPV